MKYVEIPFNAWSKRKLQDGVKTCTTRKKIYGIPGDRFRVGGFPMTNGGLTYQITEVRKITLGNVANHYYIPEGARSPEEFIVVWETIHPFKGYRPEEVVFIHFFEVFNEKPITDRERDQGSQTTSRGEAEDRGDHGDRHDPGYDRGTLRVRAEGSQ